MTNTVPECVTRVNAWNAARYNQIYNYELAEKLLVEEISELFAAQDIINQMDAIGDIMFVAIGIFWKLKLPVELIQDCLYFQDLRVMSPIEASRWKIQSESAFYEYIDETIEESYPGVSFALHAIFHVCLPYLASKQLQHLVYDILAAICTSNETKSVKRVVSTVKANDGDKGDKYIPPTTDLKKLYDNTIKLRKVN